MNKSIQTIVLTPGEPAGIGPDLAVMAANETLDCALVAVCDPALLEQRARMLGVSLKIIDPDGSTHQPGTLQVIPVSLAEPAICGELSTENAGYVLKTLDIAVKGCIDGRYHAMVTGPVQKSIINDAGIAFSGHTEYLAAHCGNATPVMMLASSSIRVMLYTTHIPLAEVSSALNAGHLAKILRICHADLKHKFRIDNPVIAVCGLNPHAGEDGHLGREEIEIMIPTLDRCRDEGINCLGPLPADTAFTKDALERCDAVLAMYHDQGLPVIKHSGFGQVVNITLGLPIIRTSVDHGTALDLAGTGRARADSLIRAIEVANALGTTGN